MGLNNTIFTNESPGLFNGNIAAMMTDIKRLAPEQGPSVYGYAYDQLHRIKNATHYTIEGSDFVRTKKYDTQYQYDPDGNLQNLHRKGQEENTLMDRLLYEYGNTTRPNQLTQVNDQASDGTPGQFSGTEVYVYDQIGNLTETTSNGNLTEIDWDVYNKVKQVTNENLLTRYLYDGAGNRVLTFKNVGFEDQRPVITGYSRDATGNTLAVYDLSNPEENPFFTPQMQETYIYGSNRIGVDITPRNYLGNYFVDSYHKDLTTTHYEISNHLGNVLTTVTGRKLGQGQEGVVDFYLPEVVTATDYYAFGAQMPGRSYENTTLSGTNGYRYAFNGKEHDSDGEFGSLTHYDFSARIYSPSIGRFLSVDMMTSSAPGWTPYRFGFNNPIFFIDPDGMFETKAAAKAFAKEKRIKTDWISRTFGSGSKIIEGKDKLWSIDNKKNGWSIFQDKTLEDEGNPEGIFTAVLASPNDIITNSAVYEDDLFGGKHVIGFNVELRDETKRFDPISAGHGPDIGPGRAIRLLTRIPKGKSFFDLMKGKVRKGGQFKRKDSKTYLELDPKNAELPTNPSRGLPFSPKVEPKAKSKWAKVMELFGNFDDPRY